MLEVLLPETNVSNYIYIQEHASLRLRAEETHSWLEDVAARAESTALDVQHMHGNAATHDAHQATAIAQLQADVQWLMAHSSRAAPLEPTPREPSRANGRLCSFPLVDVEEDVEEELRMVDAKKRYGSLWSFLDHHEAKRCTHNHCRTETSKTSGAEWVVGTEPVRLTPLLARGEGAVAQLDKLSARVAALRDRLQQDE